MIISRVLVTNTKAAAWRKMNEPAKKNKTSFSSMFKNVPNTIRGSSSDSIPLLNNT